MFCKSTLFCTFIFTAGHVRVARARAFFLEREDFRFLPRERLDLYRMPPEALPCGARPSHETFTSRLPPPPPPPLRGRRDRIRVPKIKKGAYLTFHSEISLKKKGGGGSLSLFLIPEKFKKGVINIKRFFFSPSLDSWEI